MKKLSQMHNFSVQAAQYVQVYLYRGYSIRIEGYNSSLRIAALEGA